MSDNNSKSESFKNFKDSFFYGSRTDLNLKFLHHLNDNDAAEFFHDFFKTFIDAYDGRKNFKALEECVVKWQQKSYNDQENFEYDKGPFTKLNKPLSQLTLGLMTSSGHFVKGDDPKPFGIDNMTQNGAIERIMDFLKEPPQLSVIPKDTPKENLKVRHGGYDINGAVTDPNVAFPLEILNSLVKDGKIGALSKNAYSFVGACAQLRLLKKTGPAWVERFKKDNMDALLLVPV